MLGSGGWGIGRWLFLGLLFVCPAVAALFGQLFLKGCDVLLLLFDGLLQLHNVVVLEFFLFFEEDSLRPPKFGFHLIWLVLNNGVFQFLVPPWVQSPLVFLEQPDGPIE
jgi:hypothetical protein